MTKWRTPKSALISVLWMLCAFMMPMASSVCAMPASMAPECAMMSRAATASQSTWADAKMPCCAVDKSAALRCCPVNQSAPALIVPVVAVASSRVLDVATEYDASVVQTFSFFESRKVSFQLWQEEQGRQLYALEQAPPSGRAPPVVLL